MPTSRRTLSEFQANAKAWVKFKASAGAAARLIEEPIVFRNDLFLNANVLCLGCGSAEECATVLRLGAARVVGVDRCLELLKYGTGTGAQLCVMDIEKLAFQGSSFDVVLCRFVAHYLDNWVPFLSEIKRVLRPKGIAVISVYHPLYLAMDDRNFEDQRERSIGFRSKDGNTFTVSGDYLQPQWVTRSLHLGKTGPVLTLSLHARPFSAIMNDVTTSGLMLKAIYEPAAGEESSLVDLPLYQVHSRIPLFLILDVGRRD